MSKLPPWQQKIIDGFKPGQMNVLAVGRQTGKSAFARLWQDVMAARPIEDLILSESPVHGSRYYCVEPVGGQWVEMEAWCREKYGEPGEIWESLDFTWPEVPRWIQNNRKFWFRNERDRTMFILRWSR